MKGAIILCFFAVTAVTIARPNAPTYTDKYDSIDLDEILHNDRLLEGYVKCICDEGKCTPDGKELRAHIKEAIETDCAKCTPAQRRGSERVIEFLIKNKVQWWNKVKAKHDPTGKYAKKFEDKYQA